MNIAPFLKRKGFLFERTRNDVSWMLENKKHKTDRDGAVVNDLRPSIAVHDYNPLGTSE
jgi:hypothetical protein